MSQFRHIIDSAIANNQNALDLRCNNLEELLGELSRYNDFTSRASYVWQRGRGLYRIDMPYLVTPNTATFESALAHIQRSNHFGLYLFDGIVDEFKVVSTWASLRKFVADRSANRKVLLFSGTGLRVPDHMSNLFARAELQFAAKPVVAVTARCA